MPSEEVTQKLRRLAASLAKGTREGKYVWKQNEKDRFIFALDLPTGSVWIRSIDKDDEAPYRLAVFPKKGGTALEKLEDTPRFRYNELASLYEVVRTKVLGVDTLIDGLLRDVESEGGADDDIPF
jgi:hypothetical protein